jgi:hypothetical protein
MSSTYSASLKGLQFSAAFLAEGTQRIYRVVVYQLSQLRKRLVRCDICVDNHANDRLRLFNHGRTSQHAHLAYQRIDADQCRNLCFVVREGVGAQLRCLIDELLVQLLPSSLILRESCSAVLTVLSERADARDVRSPTLIPPVLREQEDGRSS